MVHGFQFPPDGRACTQTGLKPPFEPSAPDSPCIVDSDSEISPSSGSVFSGGSDSQFSPTSTAISSGSDDSGYITDPARESKQTTYFGHQPPPTAYRNSRRSQPSYSRPPALVSHNEYTQRTTQLIIAFSTSLVASLWPLSERGRMPLHTFISESVRRSKTSYSTLHLALYYIILLKDHVPIRDFTQEHCLGQGGVEMLCGRRMFLTAIILAAKFLQDKTFSTAVWEKITGLKAYELNRNEWSFLEAIDFRLHVSKETFHIWTRLVSEVCDRSKRSPLMSAYSEKNQRDQHSHDWSRFVWSLDPANLPREDPVTHLLHLPLPEDFRISLYDVPIENSNGLPRPEINPGLPFRLHQTHAGETRTEKTYPIIKSEHASTSAQMHAIAPCSETLYRVALPCGTALQSWQKQRPTLGLATPPDSDYSDESSLEPDLKRTKEDVEGATVLASMLYASSAADQIKTLQPTSVVSLATTPEDSEDSEDNVACRDTQREDATANEKSHVVSSKVSKTYRRRPKLAPPKHKVAALKRVASNLNSDCVVPDRLCVRNDSAAVQALRRNHREQLWMQGIR